ncbi:DnaJ domain-containing protein [Bradyrhizobium sp. SRL28]|uniref:DnaJ domain-containing protein n=1 Tax=Bradyrhizobium sp. SRL28 TaxID=2836178 RepID=UPI001BDEB1BB|nr:DnaJ domain-containing protein [Bradyrhizobium sp. SRL28]MBT1513490.1 DnaJ domain-containing protein [Bradyrhizobium sp. SRL28]
MATLYDLLEALPDDDADGLRAAFRKAAKACHPDVNPGDPEAAERFRRIVRANAILSDEQQRAAYDRLLVVARRQQSREPKRSKFSGMIRRLAADAIASAAVSAVLVGGYLLFRPVDGLRVASAQVTEVSRREPAQALTATEISDASGRTGQHDQLAVAGADMKVDVNRRDAEAPTKPDGIAPAATTGMAPASAHASPAREVVIKDAQYYRERGISAYRSGDLYIALANFDLAIEKDPSSSDSYINRGIVFRRLGDLKRALSDVAEAKRIDDLNPSKSTAGARAP